MEIKEKFKIYKDLLINSGFNLVSKSTLTDIENRHFKDSAQLVKYIHKQKTIIDIGSGGGFPGVVLAILGYEVVCVESITKKQLF